MKKQKIYQITGVVILAFVLAAIFGYDFTGGSEAAGLISFAAAAVVGVPVEGMTSVSELQDTGIAEQDIDQDITKISPNKAPLDTIMRNIRQERKCVSQEVKYYQKSEKPMADKISLLANGNGVSSAAPCKAYTLAGDGVTSIWLAVSTPKLWRKSDTVVIFGLTLPGVKGSAVIGGVGTHKEDVVFYVSDKSSTAIELTPINGLKGAAANADEFVVPTFTADALIVRMGQAKSEKDLQSEPIAILPVPKVQYCQNFITQIEESTFAAMTKKEVETGIDDFDRDNLESMRREMEMSFLFGAKHKREGANGDSTYCTGGIAREITKTIEYGTGGLDRSMTAEMYMNMLQAVFVGTSGSESRVLFAGSELIKAFELLRETQKNISGTTSQETYHGVIVTKIISTFGTIRLVHNPAFDEIGLADEGLVLDMAHIYRRPFIPMVAKQLDLKSSGLKNAKAKTVQEVSCVILKYPDCHAWVRPKA